MGFYYNPHITGQYNPPINRQQPGFFLIAHVKGSNLTYHLPPFFRFFRLSGVGGNVTLETFVATWRMGTPLWISG